MMNYDLDQSLLHLLHRASQVADERFARAELPLTARQFVVLQAISIHPEGSQTDLVRATAIDRSTMADIIRRLHKQGLLVRRRRRDDARAYAVKLSARGEDFTERGRAVAARTDYALHSGLRGGDLVKLVSTLKALLNTSEVDLVPPADAIAAHPIP